MEEMLIAVNDMMLEGFGLALIGCYLWGIISTLLSPCHLASIPLLISYTAGQGMTPQHAARHAALFNLGLFVAVFIVGGACALLGRMLGDVPGWIYAAVGLILVYMGMQRFRRGCDIAYGKLFRRRLSGCRGAFWLGLLYGILSGACTFGFLAPMLTVITQQQQLFKGLAMTVVFALGHCTPIVAAGCGFGLAETRYLACADRIRTLSGFVIVAIGLYFIGTALF